MDKCLTSTLYINYKVKRWFEFIFTILHVFLSRSSTFEIRIILVLIDKIVDRDFVQLLIVYTQSKSFVSPLHKQNRSASW